MGNCWGKNGKDTRWRMIAPSPFAGIAPVNRSLYGWRVFNAAMLVVGDFTVTEDRIIEIETRLAHQEVTIQELNDVVTDQQARISHLEALYRALVERMQSLASNLPAATEQDERPPHY